MTNKTLSQQLCEVCGIEPEIIGEINGDVYKAYPDFENNNNNFVELFELSLPKICGVKFTISQLLCESIEFKFSDKRTFLVQLLEFINICKNFGRFIKKAIRETNWEC